MIDAYGRFVSCMKDCVYVVAQDKHLRLREERLPSERGMPLVPEKVSDQGWHLRRAEVHVYKLLINSNFKF